MKRIFSMSKALFMARHWLNGLFNHERWLLILPGLFCLLLVIELVVVLRYFQLI
ncbi:hypothetical protein Meth11DRAFT_1938 [Methylophilaceae bacterium 11]|nr:hypothetical protein Meth11DRAFT_1938 [Methylophilaceae bacterium 11]